MHLFSPSQHFPSSVAPQMMQVCSQKRRVILLYYNFSLFKTAAPCRLCSCAVLVEFINAVKSILI